MGLRRLQQLGKPCCLLCSILNNSRVTWERCEPNFQPFISKVGNCYAHSVSDVRTWYIWYVRGSVNCIKRRVFCLPGSPTKTLVKAISYGLVIVERRSSWGQILYLKMNFPLDKMVYISKTNGRTSDSESVIIKTKWNVRIDTIWLLKPHVDRALTSYSGLGDKKIKFPRFHFKTTN